MQFSIVIPAYNEGVHIERVVRDIADELQKVESDFEVIVVDNGSTDATEAILQSLVKEMPRLRVRRVFPNRGYGGGILEGLSVARGEILGWTDGDGQVRAIDLRDMYKKMREHKELVFFKAKRTARGDGILRAIQSGVYNFIFHILFPSSINKFSDVNAKPKLFRRSFYEHFNLTSVDYFIDPEVVIKALRLRTPIAEYPIPFLSRKQGSSNMRIGTGLEYLKNLLYYKFFH